MAPLPNRPKIRPLRSRPGDTLARAIERRASIRSNPLVEVEAPGIESPSFQADSFLPPSPLQGVPLPKFTPTEYEGIGRLFNEDSQSESEAPSWMNGINVGSQQNNRPVVDIDSTSTKKNSKGVVQPIAGDAPKYSSFRYASAAGAADSEGTKRHAGMDWFAKVGTPVKSPVAGKIIEVKRSKGSGGKVFGGVVKVQGKDGKIFVFRHVDPTGLKVNQQVKAGFHIASVGKWDDGSPHAHIEIWKGLGDYKLSNMIDPYKYFGGK